MKFLLTGTFCSQNKGDAAMQLTMGRLLREIYPDSEVVISAPYPELDRHFYEGITLVKCHRRNLIYGFIQCAGAWLWKKSGSSVFLLDDEMKACAEADLVIDLSGDMLTEDYGPHVAISHFLPILLANAAGRKVFVCGQSIGPFKFTRSVARYVLEHAGAVTVRDQLTLDHLRALGVSPRRLAVTADLAFSLKPSKGPEVNALLEKYGLAKHGGPLLGVSVSHLVDGRFNKLCPNAANTTFWELMARAIDGWVAERNLGVVFVAHVTGPGDDRDDRVAARKVANLMKFPAVVVEEDLGPESIKGIIRICDLFVGARMHANIAALSSRIPTLAISYSHKTMGIMNQLGCGEFVAPVAELNDSLLNALFYRLFDERENVRQRLGDRLPGIETMSRANMEKVAELLTV
ncbi:MAG: polysaccharide pyruvyl transferase family protein [Puniceicoccales bacterium]